MYSFDKNSDVSAVRTLLSIFKVKEPFPVVVLGDQTTINGYKEKEEMEKILQNTYPKETREILEQLKNASTTINN